MTLDSARRRRRLVRSSGVVVLSASLAWLPLQAAEAQNYAEQQGHHGANTFRNYHNASDMGPRIEPAQWVEVSCKVYDPFIESVNPDGYWYRIASSPWNNEYYAAANTFMNGDPWEGPYQYWTDFNVPDCGSESAPPPTTAPPTTSPPPPTTSPPPRPQPSVSLAQGPVAEFGYRYAVTVRNFTGSSVTVRCYDSVDSGGDGFYQFQLPIDGSGNGFTQSQCYSADGPDHWVVVDGVESNHATWGSTSSPGPNVGGGGTPTTATPTQTTQPPAPEGQSVFFSPHEDPATGVAGITPADQNLKASQWSAGDCTSSKVMSAIAFDHGPIDTLAGWSLGRLGPIYYLMTASPERLAAVHRVVLFDPGATSDFDEVSWWRRTVLGRPQTCDWRLQPSINETLANWLRSNDANRLIIVAGAITEEKSNDQATYAGLWRFYLADIWEKPFSDHALICNYDGMEHGDILRNFYGLVQSSSYECPPGSGRTHPWNP